ncbi:hypothetical protein ACP70R_015141 [Stipagrostis hirtigluma subsp. patula]
MEPSGGEIAAKRANASGDDAGAGEDLLSKLPDDTLVLILRRLDTAAAGRTSVLSRRWRRVWRLLPELRFLSSLEPRLIASVLADHEAALRYLLVETLDAAAESVGNLLTAAAPRLSGGLVFENRAPGRNASGDGEEAGERGVVELPCLENATAVTLDLGFLGLAVPPAGVFTRLTKICLKRVRFQASLTIVATALKSLTVECFFFVDIDQPDPVANISAPQLKRLDWMCSYGPNSVNLGNLEQLQQLGSPFFVVYGIEGAQQNRACLGLLQRFKVVQHLCLRLVYMQDIDDCQYLMEDMRMLPDITSLSLAVLANGHAFGASSFHVLRMCTGIRKLMLALKYYPYPEAQLACPSGCICRQQTDWKTDQLLLNCLQEVDITGLKGAEHEIAFVEKHENNF